MAKRGQPTKFRERNLPKIEYLSSKGYTDKQLAEYFSVTETTINNWKQQFPQFFESLKKGKLIADSKVEVSLYDRACGYSHPDVHISNYQGKVTVTPIIKHYPPDPTSMIFWLKNRQPDEWKDRVETPPVVDQSKHYHFTNISEAELVKRARQEGIRIPPALERRYGQDSLK